MSSVHLSGSPRDEGAGTNCLQSGHGKPTGFSLDLHVDRMYDDKQLWQNVWKHGKYLGVLNDSKQIGHTFFTAFAESKDSAMEVAIFVPVVF